MRIDILTALPSLLDSYFNDSILRRAQEKGSAEVHIHDLRTFSEDKHKRVDDYPFGGGAGMVMTLAPIHKAISCLKAERTYDEVIYMSPDGELLDQPLANRLSTLGNLIILCGHYKGVDERVREHLITREVSIGNYVLSGGELPAAVLSDAIIRLLPGVMRPGSRNGGTNKPCSAPLNGARTCRDCTGWALSNFAPEYSLILRPRTRDLTPKNAYRHGQDQAARKRMGAREANARLQGR